MLNKIFRVHVCVLSMAVLGFWSCQGEPPAPGTADPAVQPAEILIQAGTFLMGSPANEPRRNADETQHQVTLTRPFFLGKYEVTQREFKDLMRYNNSNDNVVHHRDYGGETNPFGILPDPRSRDLLHDDYPVRNVRWDEALAYCNAASRAADLPECFDCTGGTFFHLSCEPKAEYTGANYYKCLGYRLPTEAEWEYAYRAGTTTALYNGEFTESWESLQKITRSVFSPRNDPLDANYSSRIRLYPVGGKEPNRWGLYDMAGNVWEWTYDGYGDYPSQATTDPINSENRNTRVLRGGSWHSRAWEYRAAHRKPRNRKESAPRTPQETRETSQVAVLKGVKNPLIIADAVGFRVARSGCGKNADCGGKRDCVAGVCVAHRSKEVLVHAGEFWIGSLPSELGRQANETRYRTTLARSFWMRTHEVTQGEFKALMDYNPSSFSACGDACPVETVSWHEAAAYCNAASRAAGVVECFTCTASKAAVTCNVKASYRGANYPMCPGYRLPTEAEWEYAYRAGTNSALYNAILTTTECSDPWAEKIAWYCGNAEKKTHPVGGKEPNGWGLYDMAGNVWEWVYDWYGDYSAQTIRPLKSSTPYLSDPTGPTLSDKRVLRGGAWNSSAREVRAAQRRSLSPIERSSILGFRVVGSLCRKDTDCVGDRVCTVGVCSGRRRLGEALVAAGSFLMGSPTGELGREIDERRHQVTLTRPFFMKAYEVSQDEFQTLMGYNHGRYQGGTGIDFFLPLPAENVHWHEALAYCNAASRAAGLPECFDCAGSADAVRCKPKAEYAGANYYKCLGYRLPTEAEWEYAYRAGTTTALYNGELTKVGCSDPNADPIAWYCNTTVQGSPEVRATGMKKPNAWGLFDMAGSVSEWVYDGHKDHLPQATVDPIGPENNTLRVARGGHFKSPAEEIRAAKRFNIPSEKRFLGVGFRPVRTHP